MEVLNIIEKEDGSAELLLELTEEENRSLIEYAIIDILTKVLEKTV